MNRSNGMIFNIFVKKENELFVAHCMELDIVATGQSIEEASQDLIDLIIAQLRYAFGNNNLDHLYRPAPAEVWREFYMCKELLEEKEIRLPAEEGPQQSFMPPWIITKMCRPETEWHV